MSMGEYVGTDTQTVRSITTAAEAAEKAAVLIEALPWLHRFHDAVIVVKLGGNAMVDFNLTRAFAQDMAFLRFAGIRPVVVHGGGPQITAALEAKGIPSEFRGGYRVTTDEAIPVVREVLVEEVAGGITAKLERFGGLGVRVPGDTGVLTGVRKGVVVDGEEVDLGLVGEVTSVDPDAIQAALAAGKVPVISTVAREEGSDRLLNVNADSAAAAIATALGAAKLIVLTNVAGLYANWPDTDSLISHIGADELRDMLPALESGMIPKMEACLAAVDGGVAKAAVIDGRQPHSVLLEIFTDTGIGTEVVAS
ncbi:MAG TPA: acetylglutamate kinase [Microbacteriaceae bacterium]|nr:acetylglutamate kinase [Microbacteriaceae bacterium]